MTTLIPKFEQTGSTTNRPINLKLAETISVMDFGASPSNTAAANVTAIQAAVAAINAAGGGILHFPPGNYHIITTPTAVDTSAPTALFGFLNCTGVGVQCEGATIIDDTVYTLTAYWSLLFSFDNCTNISFDINAVTQHWTQTSAANKRGLNIVAFLNTCVNVSGKLNVEGGIVGIWAYNQNHDGLEHSRLFNVQINASYMEYPLLLEDSGNQTTAQIFAQQCGRNFFIHGVKDIDIQLRILNNQGTSIIGSYNGQGCSNVNVNIYDRDSTSEYITPLVLMQMLDNVAAAMRNIKINFNIYNLSAPAEEPIFGFYAQYAGIGHIIDGLDISGIIECGTQGLYAITNKVAVVGGQQMTTADYMRRINFHDLTITGAGGAGNIDCDLIALKDVATVTNVTIPNNGSSIFMRNATNGRVVYQNVNANNFTDSTSNTDVHTYINTTQTAPQSQINKTYIDAIEGTQPVNVLNGYIINIKLLANAGVASLAIPGNISPIAIANILGDGGNNAIINLQGGNHATQVMSDPLSKYSNTSGTGSKTNVYWNGTNYELQNNTGSTQSYQVQLMSRNF